LNDPGLRLPGLFGGFTGRDTASPHGPPTVTAHTTKTSLRVSP